MNFPRFMRHVNRVFTNPLMGTIAWAVPPLAIVHHIGRKSGRSYRTPVVAFSTPTGFVIPLTYGRDVDWARNLVSAGGGELQRLGRRHKLCRPRIVGSPAGCQHLPAGVRPLLRAANLPGYVLLDFEKPSAGKKKHRREQ